MSRPVADLLALFFFAATGVYAHHHALPLAELLKAVWPFWLAWVLVAPFTGTWKSGEPRKLLLTWAVAVPAGVVVRFIAYAEPLDARRAMFFITSLVFSLPYLLLFRYLAGDLRRRR